VVDDAYAVVGGDIDNLVEYYDVYECDGRVDNYYDSHASYEHIAFDGDSDCSNAEGSHILCVIIHKASVANKQLLVVLA
tara:strand:+ start:203 stop:439 length:237 start_codon:yes stop_codon:yes gene_type:complete